MHEYQPTVTLPHQSAFVLYRLKKKMDEKTEVTTCDEGEESSYIASDFENPVPEDTNPVVYDHTEEDLESVLLLLQQPQNYDASSSQLPLYNQQEPSFVDSTFTSGHNEVQFQSDHNEHDEDQTKFVHSLFVDQDEYSYEEILHSSDTDTDTAQARCDHFLGISTLFNEHVAPKEYRQMPMVQSGTVSSSNHGQYREETNGFLHDDFLGLDAPSVSPAADVPKFICCISRVSSESSLEFPLKIRASKPKHHRRSHRVVGQTAARRRFQLKRSSSIKAVSSQEEAKGAMGHSITVDLPKEKTITESNKEQKIAQGTNAKEILKSTRDGTAGSTDAKGYLIFQETSLLGHESRPSLLAYFVNILIGIFLFVVFIREVVSYRKLVLAS